MTKPIHDDARNSRDRRHEFGLVTRMGSFRNLFLAGVAWRTIGDFGQAALQIIFVALFARLLEPADFGLVALALIVNRFVQASTVFGFRTAVIQIRKISNAQLSAVFYLNTVLHVFVVGFGLILAPFIARIYNQSDLPTIISCLIWILLLNALSFPGVLLAKRMKFRGISVLQIMSTLCANLIALAFAYKGYGVWSLVIRLLIEKGIYTIVIWPLVAWLPGKADFVGLSKVIRFGTAMWASRLLNFASQNTVALVLASIVDVSTLGQFYIAYNLAITPGQKIQSALVSVLMPGLSDFQNQNEVLRRVLSKLLMIVNLVFAPLMLGLAATSASLVALLYGVRYDVVQVFLVPLALVGYLRGMGHLHRTVILAKGHADIVFRITLAEAVFSIPSMIGGAYWAGMTGLIVAYLCSSLLTYAFVVIESETVINAKGLVATTTWRAVTLASIMAICVFAFGEYSSAPPLVTWTSQTVLGVALYAIISLLFLSADEKRIVRQLSSTASIELGAGGRY